MKANTKSYIVLNVGWNSVLLNSAVDLDRVMSVLDGAIHVSLETKDGITTLKQESRIPEIQLHPKNCTVLQLLGDPLQHACEQAKGILDEK